MSTDREIFNFKTHQFKKYLMDKRVVLSKSSFSLFMKFQVIITVPSPKKVSYHYHWIIFYHLKVYFLAGTERLGIKSACVPTLIP